MALTDKQEAFVREYLIDMNATQAAIRAGYSKKTAKNIGNENLTKPDIQKALQTAMNKRAERTEIDQDYVLNTIQEVIERCMQAHPVLDRRGRQVYVETPDGDELPAYTFMPMAVLKGTEQLGKHLGMFKEIVEHSGKDGGPIDVRDVDKVDTARKLAYLLRQGEEAMKDQQESVH